MGKWLHTVALECLCLLALLVASGAAGDILRGVDVPKFAFAGGHATLSCFYDLRSTRLYSLKWYHNGTEFYRYVPTERNRPINIKPSHKFSVTEVFRNEQRVTLSLTRLAVSASGDYRCEVIAEHPSFRTEAATAVMTVLREALAPPVLVGAREIYEPSELIKIGCQPQQPLYDGHAPTLQWFLEGREAAPQMLTRTDPGPKGGPRLTLAIPGEKIKSAHGNLRAECRLTLGAHTLTTHKILRVRVPMISYVGNYHSPDSKVVWTPNLVRQVKRAFRIVRRDEDGRNCVRRGKRPPLLLILCSTIDLCTPNTSNCRRTGWRGQQTPIAPTLSAHNLLNFPAPSQLKLWDRCS
ncbi:uncharacterized protein [Procambarus clarkii]|uniref:uncharacterized protein isoform X2 n=1 Tax=Procambarus clarkii TaxID=6728 RepID=UPI0037443EB0